MPLSEFWQGVAEFNRGDFYACHDTLEAIWMEALEPDKRFYQGVLQIAVGCYHLENSNWRGAVILLGEGIKRLSDYQPVYEEIDVTQLLVESNSLLKELQQIEPEKIEFFLERLKLGIDSDRPVSPLPKILRVAEVGD